MLVCVGLLVFCIIFFICLFLRIYCNVICCCCCCCCFYCFSSGSGSDFPMINFFEWCSRKIQDCSHTIRVYLKKKKKRFISFKSGGNLICKRIHFILLPVPLPLVYSLAHSHVCVIQFHVLAMLLAIMLTQAFHFISFRFVRIIYFDLLLGTYIHRVLFPLNFEAVIIDKIVFIFKK